MCQSKNYGVGSICQGRAPNLILRPPLKLQLNELNEEKQPLLKLPEAKEEEDKSNVDIDSRQNVSTEKVDVIVTKQHVAKKSKQQNDDHNIVIKKSNANEKQNLKETKKGNNNNTKPKEIKTFEWIG